MTSDLWIYLVDDWPGAVAGVTQRGPHDPKIPWSGYNMGHTEQADHEAVDALRVRAMRDLLGDPNARRTIVTAQQVHGKRVEPVTLSELHRLPRHHRYPRFPGCDGLITNERHVALMLFYADCCPIILYSPDPLCGGVAHAGWRGSVANIAESLVSDLHFHFEAQPNGLHAIVGPCIGVECYEVGPEVVEIIEGLGMAQTLHKVGDSAHLDLLALNIALLQRAGLSPDNIRPIPHCTRCGPVPLFSYRRDGPATGRHAAMFMLL